MSGPPFEEWVVVPPTHVAQWPQLAESALAQMSEPVVSGPGDGERLERDNRAVTIRVDLPGLSINEIEFDERFAVDPHSHDDHVDAFYVLEGEVEFTVGEDTIVAGPGTLLAAPPGARHGFRGVNGTARVLNFHAPDAGFNAWLRSL